MRKTRRIIAIGKPEHRLFGYSIENSHMAVSRRLLMRVVTLIGSLVFVTGFHSARAQAQWPRWAAIDGAFGGAVGRGGEYTDLTRGVWRLGVQGRVVSLAGLGVIVGVDRDRYFMGGGRIDICALGSHGQCMPEFPEFSGWAGAVGLRSESSERLAITALAGLGRHRSTDGAVRHLPDNVGSGLMVHGDVALRTWRNIWLTAAAQRTDLGEIRGDRLRLQGITVGLRVN